MSRQISGEHIAGGPVDYTVFDTPLDISRMRENIRAWQTGETVDTEGGIEIGAITLDSEAATHLSETFYGVHNPLAFPLSGVSRGQQPTSVQRFELMDRPTKNMLRRIREAFHSVIAETAFHSVIAAADKGPELQIPRPANDITYLGRIEPHEDFWRLDGGTPKDFRGVDTRASAIGRRLNKYGRVYGSGLLRLTFNYGVANQETFSGQYNIADYQRLEYPAYTETYEEQLHLERKTHRNGLIVAHVADYVLTRQLIPSSGQHLSMTNSIPLFHRS